MRSAEPLPERRFSFAKTDGFDGGIGAADLSVFLFIGVP